MSMNLLVSALLFKMAISLLKTLTLKMPSGVFAGSSINSLTAQSTYLKLLFKVN